jgi:pantetheine-phosphate adenylyltransferase
VTPSRGGGELVALCPGTYDPPTNGHIDVIGRAASIFDRVVIAVVDQQIRKSRHMFSAQERCDLLADATAELGNVEVERFDCLVVEFARQCGAGTIVKGLRAISDFEYEFEMHQLNSNLAPDLESMYLMSSPRYSFLRSTGVRELAAYGGSVDALVPSGVAQALRARFAEDEAMVDRATSG